MYEKNISDLFSSLVNDVKEKELLSLIMKGLKPNEIVKQLIKNKKNKK